MPRSRDKGAEFVDELLADMPGQAARDAARLVLERWAAERITVPSLRALQAARRVDAARAAIELHQPRADVIATLQERFRVCDRQARRDFARALQVGPFAPTDVRFRQHDADMPSTTDTEIPHHAP